MRDSSIVYRHWSKDRFVIWDSMKQTKTLWIWTFKTEVALENQKSKNFLDLHFPSDSRQFIDHWHLCDGQRDRQTNVEIRIYQKIIFVLWRAIELQYVFISNNNAKEIEIIALKELSYFHAIVMVTKWHTVLVTCCAKCDEILCSGHSIIDTWCLFVESNNLHASCSLWFRLLTLIERTR